MTHKDTVFETAFCPHCGTQRPEWAKFCGKCGNDYQGPPRNARTPPPASTSAALAQPPAAAPVAAIPAIAASSGTQPTSAALLAGVAWIISGALIGYLASLQANLASIPAYSNVGTTAAWNAVAAILSIAFGAILVVRPTRSLLGASIFWGVVTVAWNGWNILNGATHWTYIGSTIGALVGLIVAAVARGQWVDAVTGPSVVCPHCGKTVATNADGICPYCVRPIAAS